MIDIFDSKDRKAIHEIADHYGLEPQLNQTIEECAELIQVIAKCKRNGIEKNKVHLAEEIADVAIMINQLAALDGDLKFLVHKFIGEKLDRQLERISKEE